VKGRCIAHGRSLRYAKSDVTECLDSAERCVLLRWAVL